MALDDWSTDRSGSWTGGNLDDASSACRFIVAMVAGATGVEPDAIMAARRGSAAVAFARGTAMYLAHVGLGMTLSDVGRQFGRDRTTVAHACGRIEDAREDESFDRILTCLELAVERWRRTFLDAGARQ